MYIVELTYIQPLEAIEDHTDAHRRFLDTYYVQGLFLASGPKIPREGGIIVASGRLNRAELDAILAQDPFHAHGLASYRVTEFSPAKFHPVLKDLL